MKHITVKIGSKTVELKIPMVPNYLIPEGDYLENTDDKKIHVSYLTEEQAHEVADMWRESFLDKVRGIK